MGKCKTNAIQTKLGTFRHNQKSRNYSGILRTLCYPDIFKTDIYRSLTYSELWHIQNAGIFRIRGIFRTLSNIYDEVFSKLVKGVVIFNAGARAEGIFEELKKF